MLKLVNHQLTGQKVSNIMIDTLEQLGALEELYLKIKEILADIVDEVLTEPNYVIEPIDETRQEEIEDGIEDELEDIIKEEEPFLENNMIIFLENIGRNNINGLYQHSLFVYKSLFMNLNPNRIDIIINNNIEDNVSFAIKIAYNELLYKLNSIIE